MTESGKIIQENLKEVEKILNRFLDRVDDCDDKDIIEMASDFVTSINHAKYLKENTVYLSDRERLNTTIMIENLEKGFEDGKKQYSSNCRCYSVKGK